jgi:RHS repeat-associated protein
MEYDSVTGLYYDHARYYDAAIGRFTSQDPKRFAAGDTNLYRYVGNDPANRVDSSGEFGTPASIIAGAAIGAGQELTVGGDRQFGGALSARKNAPVCKASFMVHPLRAQPQLPVRQWPEFLPEASTSLLAAA